MPIKPQWCFYLYSQVTWLLSHFCFHAVSQSTHSVSFLLCFHYHAIQHFSLRGLIAVLSSFSANSITKICCKSCRLGPPFLSKQCHRGLLQVVIIMTCASLSQWTVIPSWLALPFLSRQCHLGSLQVVMTCASLSQADSATWVRCRSLWLALPFQAMFTRVRCESLWLALPSRVRCRSLWRALPFLSGQAMFTRVRCESLWLALPSRVRCGSLWLALPSKSFFHPVRLHLVVVGWLSTR